MPANLYPHTQKILVVGAGYGGLPCAIRLARKIGTQHNTRVRITLINNTPYQQLTCDLFKTLRSGENAQFAFQDRLKKLKINFVEGTLYEIDPQNRTAKVRGETRGTFDYDHLILATGLRNQLPNILGLETEFKKQDESDKRIFFFRSNPQVQGLRMALRRMGWGPETQPGQSRDDFVVVIGAGSTGLEVAGELAALRGKNRRARVVLIDQKSELLPNFSGVAKRFLKKELARLNIETVLGSPVVQITPSEIHIQNSQVIPWNLMVLCTGAQYPREIFSCFGDALGSHGIHVDRQLQIEGYRDHFALGDLALIRELEQVPTGEFVGKDAQYALQEGTFLADLLAKKLFSESKLSEFIFKKSAWGEAVTLGPLSGFARFGEASPSALKKLLTPFIWGPGVEQLKNAARLRYFGEIYRPF